MKLVLAIAGAALAASFFAGTDSASAQSDRTLTVNCTVAGHDHCGENGRVGGRVYRWHRHRYWHHARY